MKNIQIIGRLTKDPELLTSKRGTIYTRLTVAVDEGSGENRTTDFLPVIAYDKTAEAIVKFFRRGTRIGLDGTINYSSTKNDDGSWNNDFVVKLRNFYFADGRSTAIEEVEEAEEEVVADQNWFETNATEDEIAFDDFDIEI